METKQNQKMLLDQARNMLDREKINRFMSILCVFSLSPLIFVIISEPLNPFIIILTIITMFLSSNLVIIFAKRIKKLVEKYGQEIFEEDIDIAKLSEELEQLEQLEQLYNKQDDYLRFKIYLEEKLRELENQLNTLSVSKTSCEFEKNEYIPSENKQDDLEVDLRKILTPKSK